MPKKAALCENPQDPSPISWFENLQIDPKKLIPVGPRFQAEIPDLEEKESNDLERLGTQTWPPTNKSLEVTGRQKLKIDEIGKGRPDSCSCKFPGSIDCVKKHVEDEKTKLQSELGPVFWEWKFHEIGEGSANYLWTVEEEKEFDSIMKKNRLTKGQRFLAPALKSLPSQNRKSIINYYLSVYIPRQIRMKTRISRDENFGTEDEAEEEIVAARETMPPKGSKKRSRSRSSNSKASKAEKGSRF